MIVVGKLSSSPNRYRGTDIEWRIDYFFSLSEADDTYYCSPEFSFGGESWYLWMQPNGRSSTHSTGYVNLGVRRKSMKGPLARLEFYLSLKTVKGGQDNEKYYTKDYQEFDYFISRSELSKRRSELVPRNVLTVLCNIKGMASARLTSSNAAASAECCHCKWFFDADTLYSHQSSCMERPFSKCSECLEVISMREVFQKHHCRKKRQGEGKHLEQKSENAHAKAHIQTEEKDAGKCLKQNSENAHAEALIRTEEKDDYNPIQKLKMTFAIAMIVMAVVTGCVFSYSKTLLSPSQPYGEGVMEVKTAEINKTDQSELAGVKESNISNSNLTGAVETKELEAVKDIQTSEVIKANDRSEVVGSIAYEVSNSNQKCAAIKPSEEVKKILTADVEETDQPEIDGSDPSEFSGSNQAIVTETKESVSDNKPPREPGKQPAAFATAIIVIVIVAAFAYAYCKTILSSTYPNGDEAKEISTEEINNSKFDRSEVVGSDESESSDSNETGEEPVSFINPSEDLETDINRLLQERRGVDVTFELETQSGRTKFFAHQLILAVMSPYFADEFYGKSRNKGHQVINLKGTDPKSFEQMLRHCYGKMPGLKTTEEVYVLFKVASKFRVRSLLNLCCDFFRHTKIEPGNVFTVLTISEEMEDKSLCDTCCKILQEKTREVIASYELGDVTPAMVHTILDLPKLSLSSENELINWIFDWAKVKSEEKSTICKSTREYLGILLQHMNFLALTMEEFAKLCKDNREFFTSDERASIYQNIAFSESIELPNWYNKDLKCRVYTGSME